MDIMGIAPGVWFPVVSVVIGFACKGILDHLTDRRRMAAESIARREGRSEAARLRRIEFQRGALIELQEMLEESGRFAARVNIEDTVAFRQTGVWGKNKLNGSLSEDLRQAQSRVAVLSSRIASEQMRSESALVRDSVAAVSLARSEHESDAALRSLMGSAASLYEHIGAELRRLDSAEEDTLT